MEQSTNYQNLPNYPQVFTPFTLADIPKENTLEWLGDRVIITFQTGGYDHDYRVNFSDFLAAFNKLPIIIQYLMGLHATGLQMASDTPLTRNLRDIQSKTASDTLNRIDTLITQSAIFRDHVREQVKELYKKCLKDTERNRYEFRESIAKTAREETLKRCEREEVEEKMSEIAQGRRIPGIGEIVHFFPNKDINLRNPHWGDTNIIPAVVLGYTDEKSDQIKLTLFLFVNTDGQHIIDDVPSRDDIAEITEPGTILKDAFWDYMPSNILSAYKSL